VSHTRRWPPGYRAPRVFPTVQIVRRFVPRFFWVSRTHFSDVNPRPTQIDNSDRGSPGPCPKSVPPPPAILPLNLLSSLILPRRVALFCLCLTRSSSCLGREPSLFRSPGLFDKLLRHFSLRRWSPILSQFFPSTPSTQRVTPPNQFKRSHRGSFSLRKRSQRKDAPQVPVQIYFFPLGRKSNVHPGPPRGPSNTGAKQLPPPLLGISASFPLLCQSFTHAVPLPELQRYPFRLPPSRRVLRHLALLRLTRAGNPKFLAFF